MEAVFKTLNKFTAEKKVKQKALWEGNSNGSPLPILIERIDFIPPPGRCCPGRIGCSPTPPSSSRECWGSRWRAETGACPGTWPWGRGRNYCRSETSPPAPTRNGKNCKKTQGNHLLRMSQWPGGLLQRVRGYFWARCSNCPAKYNPFNRGALYCMCWEAYFVAFRQSHASHHALFPLLMFS